MMATSSIKKTLGFAFPIGASDAVVSSMTCGVSEGAVCVRAAFVVESTPSPPLEFAPWAMSPFFRAASTAADVASIQLLPPMPACPSRYIHPRAPPLGKTAHSGPPPRRQTSTSSRNALSIESISSNSRFAICDFWSRICDAAERADGPDAAVCGLDADLTGGNLAAAGFDLAVAEEAFVGLLFPLEGLFLGLVLGLFLAGELGAEEAFA